MPTAPAAICRFPSAGILWVLTCGRLAIPRRARWSCTRRILDCMIVSSMVTAGVSRSATVLMASAPSGAAAAAGDEAEEGRRHPRVERVADPVAQQVEGEHGHGDRRAGEEHEPPRRDQRGDR